jgi:hypothetical protein
VRADLTGTEGKQPCVRSATAADAAAKPASRKRSSRAPPSPLHEPQSLTAVAQPATPASAPPARGKKTRRLSASTVPRSEGQSARRKRNSKPKQAISEEEQDDDDEEEEEEEEGEEEDEDEDEDEEEKGHHEDEAGNSGEESGKEEHKEQEQDAAMITEELDEDDQPLSTLVADVGEIESIDRQAQDSEGQMWFLVKWVGVPLNPRANSKDWFVRQQLPPATIEAFEHNARLKRAQGRSNCK